MLPEDRELYNQLLQDAVDFFHPRGYFVSTAVAPKVRATQTGLLYTAHDYEAHGRLVDFVVLMINEWGYRVGPPQAISPINLRRVLDAHDWKIPHVQDQEAEIFSPQEAIRRAVK